MKIAVLNDTHCGIRNSSDIFLDNANTFSQYNYKSSLWFRKVASLNYALTQYGYQFSHIIWIDSDCVFTNYIPDLHMKNVLGDYGVTYLLGPLRSLFDYSKDFSGFGVESSFMSFSKNNNGYLFYNICTFRVL